MKIPIEEVHEINPDSTIVVLVDYTKFSTFGSNFEITKIIKENLVLTGIPNKVIVLNADIVKNITELDTVPSVDLIKKLQKFKEYQSVQDGLTYLSKYFIVIPK